MTCMSWQHLQSLSRFGQLFVEELKEMAENEDRYQILQEASSALQLSANKPPHMFHLFWSQHPCPQTS
jgi:hypothetical protein